MAAPKKEILSHCGMRCDLCPAHPTHRDTADLERAAAVWKECFDFVISPAQIACDGCLGGEGGRLDRSCPVRPCVVGKKLDNCSECDEMPCERLKERWVSREEVEKKTGRPLTEEDYRLYVLPFENAPRLQKMRGSKKPR